MRLKTCKTDLPRSIRPHLRGWRNPEQVAAGWLDARSPTKYYIRLNVMEGSVESAITSKGQATIPKAIREHLRLKPGDGVKFFVHPDGSVVLLPKLPASALRGIINPRRRGTVTIEEMREAAVAGAAANVARQRRR
jgi:AbrB family looped-hinge helix DNA binding protein